MPAIPQGAGSHAVVVNPQAPAMTAADVRAVRTLMRDLNRELQTAAERRNNVAEQLKRADVEARAGYQQRLQVLDARIIGIEQQLNVATQQLAAAPAVALNAATQEDPSPEMVFNRLADDVVPIVGVVSVFLFLPFSIGLGRFLWKRAIKPAPVINESATLHRLESLQQSVDTIAVEVERISEGQRFMTKVMNERALGAGAAADRS